MDDTDDDARYPPNAYALQYHQSHTSNPFHRPKLPLRPAPHEPTAAFEDEEEDEEEEEEKEEEEEGNYGDDEADESENHPEAQESGTRGKNIQKTPDKPGVDRFGLRNSSPNLFPKNNPEYNLGRPEAKGSRDDWSEGATWILLETWGEKYLQAGKKSLKLEQWFEVAKTVSAASKVFKTDIQCRNRLDTLKKKYKKERQRSPDSKWVYYKYMDALLNSSPWQTGLPYGMDAGEFVSQVPLRPRICLNNSRFEEVRDGPGDSPSEEEGEEDEEEEEEEEEDEDDGGRTLKRRKEDEDSFRILADSIHRFGEIYERIENSKKRQMLDLEKMRMEFDRDLEMQKRRILEQTQIELAKIKQGSDDIDASVTNMSG